MSVATAWRGLSSIDEHHLARDTGIRARNAHAEPTLPADDPDFMTIPYPALAPARG